MLLAAKPKKEYGEAVKLTELDHFVPSPRKYWPVRQVEPLKYQQLREAGLGVEVSLLLVTRILSCATRPTEHNRNKARNRAIM
jgi:hypothetical protein